MIELNVKTLDGKNHSFCVPEEITVKEFKGHIANTVGIKADTQRLIYRGKVLVDEKNLKDYDVNEKTIHVVARPPPSSTSGGGPGASGSQSGASSSRTDGARGFTGTHFVQQPFNGGSGFMVSSVEVPDDDPNAIRNVVQEAFRHLSNPTGVPRSQAATSSERNGRPEVHFHVDVNVNIQNSAQLRLNHAYRMLDQARNTLHSIENEIDEEESMQTEDSSDNSVGVEPETSSQSSTQPPAAHTVDGANSQSTTGSQTESSSEAASGSSTRRHSASHPQAPRLPALADLLDAISEVSDRLQPQMERYRTILREDAPLTNTEERQSARLVCRLAPRAMHALAHAQHAATDLMADLDDERPRPVLINSVPHTAIITETIPIEVQVQSQVQQTTTVSTNATSSSSTAASSAGPAAGVTVSTANTTQSNARPVNINATSTPGRFTNSGPRVMLAVGPTTTISFNQHGQIGGARPTLINIHQGSRPSASSANPGSTPVSVSSSTLNSSSASGATPSRPQTTQSTATPPFPGTFGTHPRVHQQTTNAPLPPNFLRGIFGNPAAFGAIVTTANLGRPTVSASPVSLSSSTSTPSSSSSQQTNTSTTTAAGTQPNIFAGIGPSMLPGAPPGMFPVPGMFRPPGLGPEQAIDPYLPCQSMHFNHFLPQTAAPASQETPTSINSASTSSSNASPSLSQGLSAVFRNLFQTPQNTSSSQNSGVSTATSVTTSTTGVSSNVANNAGPTQTNTNSTGMSDTDFMNLLTNVGSLAAQATSGSGGNLPSIAEFLNRFDHMHNEEDSEGLLSDFLNCVIQELNFADVININAGQYESLERVREPLRLFIRERILENSEATDENISAGIERTLLEMDASIETLCHNQQSVDNIDLQASLREFVRQNLDKIIRIILFHNPATSDTQFHVAFSSTLMTALHELITFCKYCVSGGTNTLMAIISERIRSISPDQNSMMSGWLNQMTQQHLQSILPTVTLTRSSVERYLVYQGARPKTPKVKVPADVTASTSLSEFTGSLDLSSVRYRIPPPPSPVTMETPPQNNDEQNNEWRDEVPADWVPIIERDISAQSSCPVVMAPLSDAYLNGMPSKRRKLMHERSARLNNVSSILPDALQHAIEAVGAQPTAESSVEKIVEEARSNDDLKESFNSQIASSLEKRIKENSDFIAEKYPNSEKYLSKK